MGRTLADNDDTPGKDDVVVLSDKLWASRFGTDRTVDLVGLLKPGITVAQARAALNETASRLDTDYPATNKGWGVIVEPSSTELDGSELRASLGLLLAEVAAPPAAIRCRRRG